jgi:hypothetical protein
MNRNQSKYTFIHIPKNAGTSFREAINSSKSLLGHYIEHVSHHAAADCFSRGKGSFLVLREPIGRFCSAFYYRIRLLPACEEWAKEENINSPAEYIEYLIRTGCRWNPVMSLRSDLQSVAGIPVSPVVWVFQPQSLWFRRPNAILLQSTLDQDWRTFCELKLIPHVFLPVLNQRVSSTGSATSLSGDHIAFLRHLYSGDFALWEIWSSTEASERMDLRWKSV